jgi:hypothetical protein
MNLRVVLVEPMCDGNIGSTGEVRMSCAASFEMLWLCRSEPWSLPITGSVLECSSNMKQKLKTSWHIKQEDFESVLNRYDRYLNGRVFSESSIETSP